MKYFTKDWYVLMQHLNYTAGMTPIADKKYTDGEITALLSGKIKERIERDMEEYNTPPVRTEIDFENFQPDDFATYDMERGVLVIPSSIEEIKEDIERDYQNRLAEFENRPPFDPKKTIEEFTETYKSELKYGYLRFPEWVKGAADIRLIAMGYLPESVYKDLEAEQQRNKQLFEAINDSATATLNAENEKIPEEIARNFSFHDGEIIYLEEADGDIVMLINEDYIPYEGQTPYTKVIFVGAKIIERDENLKFERENIEIDGQNCPTYPVWLYEELYKTKDGYEAHMLLSENDLCYLTIACRDIKFEFNIDYREHE